MAENKVCFARGKFLSNVKKKKQSVDPMHVAAIIMATHLSEEKKYCTCLSRLAFFFSHSDNDPQMWKPNTQWSSIYNYVKHSKTAHFQMKESGTSNNLTFLPDQ